MGIESALLAAIIGGVGTAASIASSVDSARRQKNQAKDAATAAQKQADEASKQAEMQFNRSNQNKPAAVDTAGSGLGSTMLTGAQGVDPNSLTLSKSTLLGQ